MPARPAPTPCAVLRPGLVAYEEAGAEALQRLGAEVHRVDRGGDVTYHGPGQLVGYPVLDLRRWGRGPVWYVRALEEVLIRTLASFGIDGERSEGRPGVWAGGAKIAAIG